MTTHLIDFGTEHLRIQLLDANSGSSWSHRLVAATLVAVTAASVRGAWRSAAHRRLWGVTAAILGFLALDEISSLHAHVDQINWGKTLYAPILLILGVCVWRLADGSDQRARLLAGSATLMVSFAIHVFGLHFVQALGWGTVSWAYQVKVGLKQGTELAGWLIVAIGLWRLVLSGPVLASGAHADAGSHASMPSASAGADPPIAQ
jgi:hypothetical protein